MPKPKRIYLLFILVLAVACVSFVYLSAQAVTLQDYQKSADSASATYQAAMAAAESAYGTAISKANQGHTTAVVAAMNLSGDQRDMAITQAERLYKNAVDTAQAAYDKSQKEALNKYQAQVQSAWNQYTDKPNSNSGNTTFTITNVSRTPLTSSSNPFKAGDTTTFVWNFSNWTWVKDNVNSVMIRTKTTDTVANTTINDADFIAAMSNIKSQNLCDANGRCTMTGTWTDQQFACSTNEDNIRKREEWIVANGVESNHNIFYFKCSGVNPNPILTIPPGITVSTVTPRAFSARYSVYCGMAGATTSRHPSFFGPQSPSSTTGGTVTTTVSVSASVDPGKTNYYAIDLTNWIEWQRLSIKKWIDDRAPASYNMCMDIGSSGLSNYQSKCNAATGNPSASAGLDPATGLCITNECFGLVWTGACKTPPDSNYASKCQSSLDGSIKNWENILKEKEALYKSGNYTTSFRMQSLGIGCDPYISSWGCEDGDNFMQMAFGYNQVPVYENIQKFITSASRTFLPKISADNPIAAVQGNLNTPGSGEGAFVTARFQGGATGAEKIYFFVHNGGAYEYLPPDYLKKELNPTGGGTRNFLMEFYCPDGSAK